MQENKGRWTIVLLTCRDPAKDFRLPLAEELHLLGHKVFYIFLKRRPVVIDMDNSQEKRVFSVPKFLGFMRRTFRNRSPLLFVNSTNLVFPALSRTLRMLCGGLWCLDMHDDLLYGRGGIARLKAQIAQTILLGGSDVVVHAAPTLKRLFPMSRHLGNASSVTAIERPSLDWKKILILASVDERLDFHFLGAAAAANPELRFDIRGHISSGDPKVQQKVDELTAAHPNVHYVGSYINSELPAILGAYAVTLAPYVVGSRLTDYIDPLRFYHCLNSGMEVISTGIPKALDFGNVLHCVGEPAEVGPLVHGLAEGTIARRNIGSTASVYNWKNRAIKLLDIVSGEVSGSAGLPA
ncbi:hypothetical protein [Rhizobium binxianense]|uniref:hypothetical protein n=1 Tax=Rhizobium binxianense TaxID=3024242 RepID=UPI002360212A|nr:hypothetical protein [Rhizobium sp. MJ37]MDC9837960.1 hypothetical protein [Rhizobium sp. MJ37]